MAPTRAAPLALLLRSDLSWLRAPAAVDPEEAATGLGPAARAVYLHLRDRGASFLADLVRGVALAPGEVEDALWELVGAGVASADGFSCLRVLIDRQRGQSRSHFDAARPAAQSSRWANVVKRARTRDGSRSSHALRCLPTAAGRWSLLPAPQLAEIDADASARQLLCRYGVVFRDLLAREAVLPPWRELAVALRRMEARGEIRGGRFVNGFVGEQFAVPEALDELRALREPPPGVGELVKVAATDPLNLVGVTSAGPRVPAVVGNAVLYRNGVPLASLEAGEVVLRQPLDPGARVDRDLLYYAPPAALVQSQVTLPI